MSTKLIEIDAGLPKVEMPAKPTMESEFKSVIKETLSDYVGIQDQKARIARTAKDYDKAALDSMVAAKIRKASVSTDPLGTLARDIQALEDAKRALNEVLGETYELLDLVAEEYGATKMK